MLRPFSCWVVLAFVISVVPFGYSESTPDLATIVTRMENAQQQTHERSRAYTVTREYHLYGSTERDPKSAVVATISFIPPNEKSYTIDKVQGSDRGEKIVEHVLHSESEATKKDAPSVDRRHYEFTLLGQDMLDGHPCWILQLRPRHEDKELLSGRAWVDQRTYLIHRVDGDMSKLPSWWLKKVHVTMNFGDAGGVWMQTGTRAVADVRFFGQHIFTGQAVTVHTADEAARASAPPLVGRRPIRPVPPVLGTGVLNPR